MTKGSAFLKVCITVVDSNKPGPISLENKLPKVFFSPPSSSLENPSNPRQGSGRKPSEERFSEGRQETSRLPEPWIRHSRWSWAGAAELPRTTGRGGDRPGSGGRSLRGHCFLLVLISSCPRSPSCCHPPVRQDSLRAPVASTRP